MSFDTSKLISQAGEEINADATIKRLLERRIRLQQEHTELLRRDTELLQEINNRTGKFYTEIIAKVEIATRSTIAMHNDVLAMLLHARAGRDEAQILSGRLAAYEVSLAQLQKNQDELRQQVDRLEDETR